MEIEGEREARLSEDRLPFHDDEERGGRRRDSLHSTHSLAMSDYERVRGMKRRNQSSSSDAHSTTDREREERGERSRAEKENEWEID